MNVRAFWKKKTVIDLYTKSGNVITLTGVEHFKVITSTVNGKITKLEWRTKNGHPRLMDIQADEIEAIIERKP